ncbi:MAG TPA: formyltransferase family protein [Polyangiaceae bacterium]|nr:formyltransferase family protein [Polyangiaceae bacterium]
MTLRIAHFGLPLAACLLARDGHDVGLSVLAPVDAPGRRRLTRCIGAARILDARALGGRLERAVREALERDPPDLVVSWFWTRRLPAAWLELAKFGGIGAHPSLLPRHRGPNPYFAAIDAGDAETGVTIHRLTAEYDEGDILLTRALAVGERDSWQLARALDRPSLALLRDAARAFASGAPPLAVAQRSELATWAPEPIGDELRVVWTWPTDRVLRRVRALAPVPGLSLDIEGLELVVTRATPAAHYPSALEPGEAAVFGNPPAVILRTGDGAVALERAVLEGGREEADAVLGRLELAAAVADHLARRNPGRLG